MTKAREVLIEYIRPGKGVQQFIEDLVFEDEQYLKTFKQFPDPVAEQLTQSLLSNGFISESQRITSITKIYFFHEYFNLLQFHDENRQILGYYSDIGTPLLKTASGYQMTDWFLDIWLSPEGKLFELDVDEFDVALSNHLLSSADAEIARTTFARLIHDVRTGMYPNAYLK